MFLCTNCRIVKEKAWLRLRDGCCWLWICYQAAFYHAVSELVSSTVKCRNWTSWYLGHFQNLSSIAFHLGTTQWVVWFLNECFQLVRLSVVCSDCKGMASELKYLGLKFGLIANQPGHLSRLSHFSVSLSVKWKWCWYLLDRVAVKFSKLIYVKCLKQCLVCFNIYLSMNCVDFITVLLISSFYQIFFKKLMYDNCLV